jgi:hypothetical protein
MQIAQNMFAQIDGNGDGAITQSELEQAVTAAGGDKAGADALFAKLDPNGTGSVSQQQFIDTLQPPSAGGNTAQDALLALLDQLIQSNATAPVGGATTGTASSSTSTGTSARDALAALVRNFDPTTAKPTATQDAISALLHPSNGSSNGAADTAGAFNSTDFAYALSLYQSRLEQQMLAGISATQSAGLVTV